MNDWISISLAAIVAALACLSFFLLDRSCHWHLKIWHNYVLGCVICGIGGGVTYAAASGDWHFFVEAMAVFLPIFGLAGLLVILLHVNEDHGDERAAYDRMCKQNAVLRAQLASIGEKAIE